MPLDLDRAGRLAEIAEQQQVLSLLRNIVQLRHGPADITAEAAEFGATALELLPTLMTELRAARTARQELGVLHADLHAYDVLAASAHRLSRILNVWDKATGGASAGA